MMATKLTNDEKSHKDTENTKNYEEQKSSAPLCENKDVFKFLGN